MQPNEPQVTIPMSELVFKTTKAVAATLTTTVGVLGLFATQVADGALTWSEGGTLIGAVATAVATVAAVWRVTNEVKTD